MSSGYREPDMRRYATGNRQYSEAAKCGKASWQTCESFFYYKAKEPNDDYKKDEEDQHLEEKGD